MTATSQQSQPTARPAQRITKAIAAATLLERRIARRNLSPFVRQVFKTVDPGSTYSHNWHIDLICDYLEAVTRREIKNLVINVPPRFLKSIITSVSWPAWLLGNNPSEQIVCASYSSSLSLKHSVDCRRIIQSGWYQAMFPAVDLAEDMNLKSEFHTTKSGYRIATSVGGTVTGKGGNILLVDDPVNPEQAMSDTARVAANIWFEQTYSTRLNSEKSGAMVVIMQRLHTDDLTARLLKKGGWEHLCIPMEAEGKTVYSIGDLEVVREKGELIHEERFGPDEVKAKKTVLGSFAYAGQYQQRPAPLGGGLIKIAWFKRYKTAPDKFMRVVQSWDTANKEREINDPSVCTTWGETEAGHYLLDVYRERLAYPDLRRISKSLYAKWKPDAVLIEDKSSGQSLIQDMRADTDDKYPVIAVQANVDKVTRASTCSPVIEAGNVYLPDYSSWLVDFEMEIGNFPASVTKDQMDSVSQYLNWTKRKRAKPRIRQL